MQVKKLLEDAFIAGYRAGIGAYAHWKDGQQLVGTVGTRLSAAQKMAETDALPWFNTFIEQQRRKAEAVADRVAKAVDESEKRAMLKAVPDASP